jgi:RNA polymerase sigma factor (TIGR02999 family)
MSIFYFVTNSGRWFTEPVIDSTSKTSFYMETLQQALHYPRSLVHSFSDCLPGTLTFRGLDRDSIDLTIECVSDVTRILQAAENGDSTAAAQLLPLVYEELRKLATQRMGNEAAGHTLQPTALVHEAWLRLTHGEVNAHFANRAHFFAAAAEAMRRILVDHARRKATGKRGGEWERLNLDKIEIAADADGDTLLLVNESLEKLANERPETAEIVKLRFFAGLTLEQAGQVLGFTERTAKRHWAFARAWLYDAMKTARES